MNYSLNRIYRTIGISKQAVHQQIQRDQMMEENLSNLVVEADLLRSEHPGCGVEKMYETLKPDFLGRDRFCSIFMKLGFRVQRIKNYVRTTIPVHSKYKDLIQGAIVTRPNQLWQSDITYFRVLNTYFYIVFILDVFTRQIVGYNVSRNLRAESNMKALRMALKQRKGNQALIHHSDRGSQYIAKDYIKLLDSNDIQISMGGKAQDNAYAERINGTIKNEYLKLKDIRTFAALIKEVKSSVENYNGKRKHDALPERMSPLDYQKHMKNFPMRIVQIYSDNRIKIKSARLLDFIEEISQNRYVCLMN